MRNVTVEGYIKSNQCKLDLEFTAFPRQVYMVDFLVFFFVQILCTTLSALPVLKGVYGNDMNEINGIGMFTILGNLLIETVFMMLNLTFGMKVL